MGLRGDIRVWRLGEREEDGRMKSSMENFLKSRLISMNLEETILPIEIPSEE